MQGVSFNIKYNNWSANWYVNEGQPKSKSFSVNKYGDEQAKQMAINHRSEMKTLYGYL